MAIKYIYLDDEPPSEVQPYVTEVEEATANLSIAHFPPKSYPNQISFLREKERSGELDGLILDLRLDQFPDWKDDTGEKAEYRAATLAQEIRTRATEGNLREYPIVLWSTDKRLRHSYTRDDTSHDLFDLKVLKGEIEDSERAKRIGTRLVSLVNGYDEIRAVRAKLRGSTTRFYRFLGFGEEPSFFDHRISSALAGREGSLPAHEYSRFILRELLETPGPLISQRVLAARLGIDLARSPDFAMLLSRMFREAAYSGPFREGWSRWWGGLVEEVWRNLKNCPGPLRSLSATERVAFLRKRSRLEDLIAAEPIAAGYSDEYWTICWATGHPLDPRDGFLIDSQPRYSWQDRLYVSLEAELTGVLREKHLRIDPLEHERLQRAKVRVG